MAKLPRTPEELAREVDATLRAREEKEWARLRAELAGRWYEFFLLAGVFAFSIGVVATIILAIPSDNVALYRFMVFWLLGFVLMIVLTVEFLIRRYRTVRRVAMLLLARLKKMEKEHKQQGEEH